MLKLIFLIFFTVISLFANITLMSEENAPYNFTNQNGHFVGLATEIVHKINPNGKQDIKVMKWAKAYNIIQKKSNKVLFAMTRNAQRENMFKWVGPIAYNKIVFFAKKGSNIKINSLDSARNVNSIGTYKNDSSDIFLKSLSFDNIDRVTSDEQNLKKLINGRISLWITSELRAIHNAKKIGMENMLEKVFDVKVNEIYIAFSKDTPHIVIKSWQKALDELKASGDYDKILRKYK
jgi:polar amino acid transport system substrate-binding protein